MIKLIVATAEDNLIGQNDKMPWNIKSEFDHFRNTTLNHSLLFGRTTFLGLPAKLPKRVHYVLSPEDVENADFTIHNEEELFALFKKFENSSEILFISGGKSIYERYAKFAQEIILSRVKGKFEGNVYLDTSFLNNFKLVRVDENLDFNVEYYKRK
ncbi:dihydrofolate reductase [Mycoplasma testudineum]|uniref:dihydrofolate reductase n=1 Tax=Mycoplasma testudineum TaxID=244584 RepID=A0A4V3C331_9MOLU|nr:dihydrofolate reductase [Mycoplasma testudineum]OYD26991.1 dihydrofolate reductase [Mycoplasma testudineum]TDO20539.1 dihydrofolate reductase [Mycoplasma testudineum]